MAGIEGVLSEAALRLRLLISVTNVLMLVAALAVVDLVVRTQLSLPWPPGLAAVLTTAIVAPLASLRTYKLWQVWRWAIVSGADGRTLLVTESGIWRRTWQAVPLDRIQFVEQTSGWLQRRFDLANLAVRTAGVFTPAVPLADLETAVADDLRHRLTPRTAADADLLDAR